MVVGTDEVKSSSKHLFVQRQYQQYKEKVRNIFKVNTKDIRTTPLMWRRSAVFIYNFEHILHLFLVFL